MIFECERNSKLYLPNFFLYSRRKKVSAMQKNIAEEEIRAELKVSELRKNPGGSKKTSHVTLLAGAIKRKTSDDDKNTEEAGESKKAKSGEFSIRCVYDLYTGEDKLERLFIKINMLQCELYYSCDFYLIMYVLFV